MESNLYVKDLYIEGFKKFASPTHISLSPGINVLAGNNDSGKSTILEALHLVLTGTYRGISLNQALTQDLFNVANVNSYFDTLKNGSATMPPSIRIEATFNGADEYQLAKYEGDYNSSKRKQSGIGIIIALNREEFGSEFDRYVKGLEGNALPIEYYRVNRYTFARSGLVASSLKLRSCLIDSSGFSRSGSQQSYISHLAKDVLDHDGQITVLQAYRQSRLQFNECDAVGAANKVLSDRVNSLTGKVVSFRSDMGNKRAWESGVVAALDSISFSHAGAGSQNMVEVELALSKNNENGSNVILLEEPEAHLSHASLNKLLNGVCDELNNQQAVITTHSSFVANKLYLGNLLMVGPEGATTSLRNGCPADTFHFFEKLPGYSTLRFLLCRACFLVEGDSDELILQRAYMDSHDGRLPIQDGIEVISVGNSGFRFLQLAEAISQFAVVLTDNDGHIETREKQYEAYCLLSRDDPEIETRIAVSFPERLLAKGSIDGYSYNTLEPELVEANGIGVVNQILGKSYNTRDELLRYMKSHKTECAYEFFKNDIEVNWPDYITRAIRFIDRAIGCL
ncbi:MAG: AAA family ATPase [Collinsella sp.]|nr:AAA family ATPase [Collinsella sp.]